MVEGHYARLVRTCWRQLAHQARIIRAWCASWLALCALGAHLLAPARAPSGHNARQIALGARAGGQHAHLVRTSWRQLAHQAHTMRTSSRLVHEPLCMSVFLSVCLPVFRSVYLSVCLVHPSAVCLPVFLSILMSNSLSVFLSFFLLVFLYVGLSV